MTSLLLLNLQDAISASQAHGSPGADELTFEQLAEDHRIAA